MLEETAAGLKAEAIEIVEIADVAIAKARQLGEQQKALAEELRTLEEARREATRQFVKELEADQVRESLHAAYLNVREAYEERTAAREALGNAKDNHDVVLANATIEVKMSNSFDAKDPATGRSNKDWVESQVLAFLGKHKEYQAAKTGLAKAQSRVDTAEMELQLATTRLSVARNEARLVAAMLGVGGNNG